ncbi:S-layer homology domain-containing protein [Pseudanabaenaceae cyanobacterium LEGE 13415]|nr:S-layer homology domain-containing protein [Pseudanabaenaceae cyanobacterium LEGE 13415]
MSKFSHLVKSKTLIAVGLTTGSAALLFSVSTRSTAQTAGATFPDVQNYWAQPFITALAERNILAGYPDGTFRPEKPIERDEFAAILQAAFNQPPERQLSSGSVFRDIPQGYWAESQIKEAYEMGFISGYPGGTFRPRQPVTKTEALVSLVQNLDLNQRNPGTPQASTAPSSGNQAANQAQANNQSTTQSAPQQQRRRGFMFPIASTMLLQGLITPRANSAASPSGTNQTQNAAPSTSTNQNSSPQVAPNATKPQKAPAPVVVDRYYVDANQIPQYAVGSVAEATRARIVVNHPNVRELNPQQPATRAEVAAIVYQTLVNKGQVPPLTNAPGASQYIVAPETVNAQK